MRLLTILIIMIHTTAALAQEALPVTVSDAYAYPPIGSGNVGIGFITLSNTDTQDWELTGATSPVFGAVEIHDHIHEDGVMRMRQVPQVNIAAGESVTFKPGGLHLMLMQANKAVQAGDIISVTLSLLSGNKELEQTIEIPVKSRKSHKHAH